MVPLASLWLPVLLSSVIVFFASFILHMVLPWHKHDYARLPDEGGEGDVRAAHVRRRRSRRSAAG